MDCPFVNKTATKHLIGGELQFHTQEEACLPFIVAVYASMVSQNNLSHRNPDRKQLQAHGNQRFSTEQSATVRIVSKGCTHEVCGSALAESRTCTLFPAAYKPRDDEKGIQANTCDNTATLLMRHCT
jgi:hypothetical protein